MPTTAPTASVRMLQDSPFSSTTPCTFTGSVVAPVHRPSTPVTTVAGIVEKNTGEVPFDAPKPLLDAIAKGDFAGTEDPALKTQTVNFLTNLDTTGGNSGSPVLNARGELIGLNFDSNWESVSASWMFDPRYKRAVHVDMRYLRWLMGALILLPFCGREIWQQRHVWGQPAVLWRMAVIAGCGMVVYNTLLYAAAHHTTAVSPARGSASAMPTSPAATPSCDNSSQLRRRPSHALSPGSGTRSTSGAHAHLKP